MAENNVKRSKGKISDDDINQRRDALKKELEDLHEQIGKSVGEIKEGVQTRLDLSYWTNRYPFRVAGLSIVAGFLAGMRWSSGSRDRTKSVRGESYLWSELKRVAMRKAIQKVIDLLDEKVDQRVQKSRREN